jgi:hypothetical protein
MPDVIKAHQLAIAQVKRAIAGEMHKYDVLGEACKIKYIPPQSHEVYGRPNDTLWRCAHNIDLDQPCRLCDRKDHNYFQYITNDVAASYHVTYCVADTRVYKVAKLQLIKEVLAKLGMLPCK